MNYKDIPEYTPQGYYQVNSPWIHFEEHYMNEITRGLKLNFDPDYQRDYVWTLDQKSRYIEHCLHGGRQGRDVWLNCPGWMRNYKGPFEVVDGKQRINAVLGFLHNEVPIFGNNYYKDIEGPLPYSKAEFIIHVNDLPERWMVLQWYLEMNANMTIHTDEELDKVKVLIEQEKNI